MDHDLSKLIEIMRVVSDNRHSCAAASEDARRWCDGHDTCNHCQAALIDAIEREIASAKSAAYDQGYAAGYNAGFASADDWLADHEDAMAEHGWVKLPINVGDHVRHLGTASLGIVHAVCFKAYMNPRKSLWTALVEDDVGRAQWFDVCELELVKQPTVEDVLYDSLKHFGAVEERTPEVDSWVCEQAAKLREMLAGDAG